MSGELATLEGVTSYNRLLGDIVNIGGTGTNVDAVVRGEVGHLLETCIRYTPGARAQVIEQRVTYRERRQYSVYSGGYTGKDAKAQPTFVLQSQQNTKAWYVTPAESNGRAKPRHGRNAGQAWHQMNNPDRHWRDELWQDYQREEADRLADYAAHLAQEVRAAQGARGLTAQSWWQIADMLGIDIRVAGYIRRAAPSNGKTYQNGAGHLETVEGAVTYVLENFMPILVRGDGRGIIQRAMATREGAFDIAVKKGLFDDLTFVAKHYPALLAA